MFEIFRKAEDNVCGTCALVKIPGVNHTMCVTNAISTVCTIIKEEMRTSPYAVSKETEDAGFKIDRKCEESAGKNDEGRPLVKITKVNWGRTGHHLVFAQLVRNKYPDAIASAIIEAFQSFFENNGFAFDPDNKKHTENLKQALLAKSLKTAEQIATEQERTPSPPAPSSSRPDGWLPHNQRGKKPGVSAGL